MKGKKKKPRRFRIPTWLLLALVAAAFSGAVTLFIFDGKQVKEKPKETHTQEQIEPKGELILPNKDNTGEPTDNRRRSKLGREYASEQDTVSSNQLTVLKDKVVVLIPADANAVTGSNAKTIQHIGAYKVPCASPGSKDSLVIERQIIDEVENKLKAAGAVVHRLDDKEGNVPCASKRIMSVKDSDYGLVISIEKQPTIISALRGEKNATTERNETNSLTASLAKETGLSIPNQAASNASFTDLLTKYGVIELDGGGSSALLSFGKTAEKVQPERIADSIVLALARVGA